MSVVEELLHDHQVLRAKLALLEEWLPFTRAAPFTIRSILVTLDRRLRAHAEQEERLLESLRQTRSRPHQPTTYLPSEHQDQQETLTILLALLARGQACQAEQVETYAGHLIDSLREHMADEEERFFPFLEQAEDLSTDLPVPYPARQAGQSVHAAALKLPWRAEAVGGGSWAPQNP